MTALEQFLAKRGAVSELAKQIGISHGAVVQWRGRCPAERVVEVERATGIPREALRPDLYLRDPAPAAHVPHEHDAGVNHG
jgi:DNA-binding transcriptional regulator YdaS (Cro superfamily)